MRFFVLKPVIGSESETEYEAVGPSYGEAPRCPACGAFVGSKAWLPPYRVELRAHGTRIGDVAFGVPAGVLLSDAFVAAWQERHLKGNGPFNRVEVVEPRTKRSHVKAVGFFHLAVPKGGARIDLVGSRIVRDGEPTCDLCGGTGLVSGCGPLQLLGDSWSGEDIFAPWGINGLTLVTERVLALAVDRDLANVTTIPIEQYRWDTTRISS